MAEAISALISRYALPFVGRKRWQIPDWHDVMLWPDDECRHRFGAEDRQTGVLKVEKQVSERVAGSAVTVRDDCLDALQFIEAGILFFFPRNVQ
jgi:hypothetical protein